MQGVLDGQLPSPSLSSYHVLFSRLSVFLSVPVSLCFSLISVTSFSDSSVSHFPCFSLGLSHTPIFTSCLALALGTLLLLSYTKRHKISARLGTPASLS